MVGQLCDIKEVCGQTAHELSGAVAVIVVKGQLLHMAEQVSADIRLHQDAKGMPPVADYIRQHRPQQKSCEHHCHYREKGPVGAFRKQLMHAPARYRRKCQVNQRDHQRTDKVHGEQLPMRPEIGEKNLQRGFLSEFLGRHDRAPFDFRSI